MTRHVRAGTRLAIVTTHPIQYYAPWFRWVAAKTSVDLRVFYLWDTKTRRKYDPGFRREIEWDLPLLDDYEFEFVPNAVRRPGTESFLGLRNPALKDRLLHFNPAAVLMIGYRYWSMLGLILNPNRPNWPLIFRGDSHRLYRLECEKWFGRYPNLDLRRRGIRKIYECFSAFLYAGEANKSYFRLHGVPEQKLFFAPHAVDNARFLAAARTAQEDAISWRAELGIPTNHLVVLFAGKFEEKKRPLDLLDAFSRLGRNEVSLVFVGSGLLEDKLRRAAAAHQNIFFAPFQNQSVMPRVYASADLFVLPSYGPEESWGLAVNEALCCAKPVIVSSHVGCGPDLVRPGENGLIFEAGDVGALSHALRKALSDRNQLQRWGKKGREIISRYDYSNATAGLLSALTAVTNT